MLLTGVGGNVNGAVVVERDADDVPGRVVRLPDVVHVGQVVDGTVRRRLVTGCSFVLILLQTYRPSTARRRTTQYQPPLVPLLQYFTIRHCEANALILPLKEHFFYRGD